MGSTCPWEEIVDHVPQEKWEVEYKVYDLLPTFPRQPAPAGSTARAQE